MPGGYKVGEKVFFTAPSKTIQGGSMIVVQGQHGTVTGPADGEGYFEKGTGVQVRFPGHTGSINCLLTEVRRLRTASVATPSPAHHKRDAAHAPSVPATASAASPLTPLRAQPLAP